MKMNDDYFNGLITASLVTSVGLIAQNIISSKTEIPTKGIEAVVETKSQGLETMTIQDDKGKHYAVFVKQGDKYITAEQYLEQSKSLANAKYDSLATELN